MSSLQIHSLKIRLTALLAQFPLSILLLGALSANIAITFLTFKFANEYMFEPSRRFPVSFFTFSSGPALLTQVLFEISLNVGFSVWVPWELCLTSFYSYNCICVNCLWVRTHFELILWKLTASLVLDIILTALSEFKPELCDEFLNVYPQCVGFYTKPEHR